MKKAVLILCFLNIAILGHSQDFTVAITDFTARSGYSEEELGNITELFAGFLLETKQVKVLTRSQWGAILKEYEFQFSGYVADSEIRRLGIALGAQAVITGTMMKLGNNNILNLSLLDIESGEMLSAARKTFTSLDEFLDLLPALAQDIIDLLFNKKTYKIGDRGPAGGWIFYDKGSYSDGWRYLETAIDTTESDTLREDRSSYYDAVINGTGEAIGFGKRNSKVISGQVNTGAALYCTNLDLGGFKDWFLPSLEELKMIHENLHKKNIGKFRDSFYVSSSLLPLNNAGKSSSICLDFRSGLYTDFERGGWPSHGVSDLDSIIIIRAVRAF
jgi:TolB-like protein